MISLYLLSIENIPLNLNQRFYFHCLYFTSSLLKASSTHKTLADSLPFPSHEATHSTTTIIASLPSSRFPFTLPLLKHQFSLQFVFPFRPLEVPLYHFILHSHSVDGAVAVLDLESAIVDTTHGYDPEVHLHCILLAQKSETRSMTLDLAEKIVRALSFKTSLDVLKPHTKTSNARSELKEAPKPTKIATSSPHNGEDAA
jgi:hypothetical protein